MKTRQACPSIFNLASRLPFQNTEMGQVVADSNFELHNTYFELTCVKSEKVEKDTKFVYS